MPADIQGWLQLGVGGLLLVHRPHGIMASTERPRAASTAGAVVATWVGGHDVPQRTCSFADCGRPWYSREWCKAHYSQWLRKGVVSALRARIDGPIAERFWPKVDRSGGPDACWPWLASIQETGYGVFAFAAGDHRKAHRIAYELVKGPIPDGLQIDHLCRNKRCVNPAHLEPVTASVNALRHWAAAPRRRRSE